MGSKHSAQSKNLGTLIHLSTFSKYFFPFGNFIFPLVLWFSSRKETFIDLHGKECLNFQISLFLYAVALVFIGFFGSLLFGFGATFNENEWFNSSSELFQNFDDYFPFLIFIGIICLLLVALFLMEIICVLQASVKASEAKPYHYPLSIPFIPVAGTKNEEPRTFKKETYEN